MVGLGRFELPTSRLSGVRSNQLSYRPDRAGAWKQVKGCEDGGTNWIQHQHGRINVMPSLLTYDPVLLSL